MCVWLCLKGGPAMSENKVKYAILRITLISEKRELEWVRVLSVCNMKLNVWTYRFPQAAPYCPINHAHYSDVKLNMLIVTLLRKMKVFLWRRRAWFEAQGVCGVSGVCVFVCGCNLQVCVSRSERSNVSSPLSLLHSTHLNQSWHQKKSS